MTVEELTKEILKMTKSFTVNQQQNLWVDLQILAEWGQKLNFPHAVEKTISRSELTNLIIKKTGLENKFFDLSDECYPVISLSDMVNILTKRGERYKANLNNIFKTDVKDCDNFAYKQSSDISWIFEVTTLLPVSGYMVVSSENKQYHKFNLAVCYLNELRLFLYEPQENFLAEFIDGKAYRNGIEYTLQKIEGY